jgi:hypothetical protein
MIREEAFRLAKGASLVTAMVTLLFAALVASYNDRVEAQSMNPGPSWSCSLDDIGATLTRCAVGSDVPSGLARYITDITAQSTTTTGGGFILRTGTGTNCATGTVSLFPSAATAARWGAAANTAAPSTLQFRTPILVPDGKDLCVLGRATDTTTIQIGGYLAPK